MSNWKRQNKSHNNFVNNICGTWFGLFFRMHDCSVDKVLNQFANVKGGTTLIFFFLHLYGYRFLPRNFFASAFRARVAGPKCISKKWSSLFLIYTNIKQEANWEFLHINFLCLYVRYEARPRDVYSTYSASPYAHVYSEVETLPRYANGPSKTYDNSGYLQYY